MAFLERAKSMHARGETARAAMILAQGLKREPQDAEAVEWLLHLYVEEIPSPGMERELLQILCQQPNGRYLLDVVRAELEETGNHEKLKALDKTQAREGVLLAPLVEPAAAVEAVVPQAAPSAPSAIPAAPAPAPPRENWAQFDNPLDVRPATDVGRPRVVLDASPEPVSEELLRQYVDDRTLPSEVEPQPRAAIWIAIVAVALVCAAAVIGYAVRPAATDEAAPSWDAQASPETPHAEGSSL
ncbi:MAG: hypothetical protein H6700_07040 [Myxococcales bacterium]|nr:hypothetical protein [Myxococcales bacterium]MCB9520580.1 hypothetical protein [Myxococcales bacterium]MCB9531503.1 hypothetical protein [Myxococcales bacterium]